MKMLKSFGWKALSKQTTRKTKRMAGNIKIYFKKMGLEGMVWIRVDQDTV
jgi:hypothetical protein